MALLTSIPQDCLTSIVELIPKRNWPQLRATCRDLRAAVRDATSGLVIDLQNLPFFPTTTPSTSSFFSSPSSSSSSAAARPPLPLPTDELLLSRVREVRLLLHKDRDESSLTADGLGRAEACPVAPLLREIARARSAAVAAAEAAAEADGGASRPLPPLRVSLSVRSPRSVIAACVPEWLRESGIAALVNGTVDLRADGALRGGFGTWDKEILAPRPRSSSSQALEAEDGDERDPVAWNLRRNREAEPVARSWGGLSFPPECRFRVETKLAGPATSAVEASADLLQELGGLSRSRPGSESGSGGGRVTSLSVLSMALPFPSAALAPAGSAALARGFRSFEALAETLEELKLAETVPSPVVLMAMRGCREDREPTLRWPALRKMTLLGSPANPRDYGGPWPFRDDGGPWSFRGGRGGGGRGSGGSEEQAEEEPLDLLPSLETFVVRREHARGWLRRFGDVIDPARVTVERR